MPPVHKTPSDLARLVGKELRKRKTPSPSDTILTELFQTLYFSSLKTEESQPIFCYVVYINPDDPDPAPPQRIVNDRWSYVRLEERIPFSVSSLIKIAKASDPRTSSFAVYHDHNEKLFIWGLVDQGNRYFDFVNFESESGPERPGLFQASILGVGHLAAYRGYDRIAELNVDSLIIESHDVLRHGPVKKLLQPGMDRFFTRVAQLTDIEIDDVSDWRAQLEFDFIATLSRLLLRIRNFRHGGALLMTPDLNHAELKLKYKTPYNRLRIALEHRATNLILKEISESSIYDIMEEPDSETISAVFCLEESIASDELTDSNSELDGAVWFVSLLSRVDGLVLLSFDLEVKAFGVELLHQVPPPRVCRSTTAAATARSLHQVDYQHFGTRHRSMMRYCFNVPGSLGFVVSQDGDVRVMTRIGDVLVFWDSVRLQYDEFVRQRRRRDAIEKYKNIAQQHAAPEPAVQ